MSSHDTCSLLAIDQDSLALIFSFLSNASDVESLKRSSQHFYKILSGGLDPIFNTDHELNVSDHIRSNDLKNQLRHMYLPRISLQLRNQSFLILVRILMS